MHLAFLVLHRGGGHHLAYVRAVVREAKRRQWKSVTVLSREATEHASFETIRKEFTPDSSLVPLDGLMPPSFFAKKNWFLQQLHRYGEARRAYSEACHKAFIPDAVFHVECDGWLAAGALLGSPTKKTKSTAVNFSVRFHRQP